MGARLGTASLVLAAACATAASPSVAPSRPVTAPPAAARAPPSVAPVFVSQEPPAEIRMVDVRAAGDLFAVAAAEAGTLLLGPDGAVRATLPGCAAGAMFTGDGAHVVVMGCHGEADVWDVATDDHHPLGVRDSGEVLPASGSSIFGVGGAEGLILFDGNEKLSRIPAEEGRVHVISADGALVAALRTEETSTDVSVYLTSTGKLIGRTGELRGTSYDAVFSPVGDRLAIAGDRGLVLWDPRAKAPEAPRKPCAGSFGWLAWSPDGQRLAGLCDDGRLLILGRNGTVVRDAGPLQEWRGSPITFDGDRVAWTDGCRVRTIEATTGATAEHTARGCADGAGCSCSARLPPGRPYAVFIVRRDAHRERGEVLDVASGATVATLGNDGRMDVGRAAREGHRGGSWALDVHPDGRPSFTWDLRTDTALPWGAGRPPVTELPPGSTVLGVDLTTGGETLLEIPNEPAGSFTLVDRPSLARRTYAAPATGKVDVVGFSPHGEYVMAYEQRGTRRPRLLLFGVGDGRLRGAFVIEDLSSVGMSADDTTLAIGVAPRPARTTCKEKVCGELRVFDVRTGKLRATLPVREEPHQVVLDASGALAFAGQQVFDLAAGRALWATTPASWYDVIFTSDGKVWVRRGDDVGLHDARTGALVRAYPGAGDVTQASLDGTRLLTKGHDTFLLLDARDEAPHPVPDWAQLTPDGSHVVYADGRGVALRRVADGAVLRRTIATPPLYYTDDGLYDGEPAALERVRFRMGPDLAQSPMATVYDAGTPPRAPGLLRDFLAGKRPVRAP